MKCRVVWQHGGYHRQGRREGTLGGKDVDGQIMFTRVYVKKRRVIGSPCLSADPRLKPVTKK